MNSHRDRSAFRKCVLPMAYASVFWLSSAGSEIVRGAFVIGAFDSARGGFSSVEFSSSMSNFRSHLAATYLDVAYDSTGTLTSDFLSGVDVLLIGVALTGTTPITPLSVAEQGALLNFVNTGGSALLFTDNNIQFEVASDSIAQPFGLDTSGVIFGSATATVTNTNHPVTALDLTKYLW